MDFKHCYKKIMGKNKIFTIILLMFSYSANAQFSIDVYSSFNYSKEKHAMPWTYDYFNYQTFFSNKPIDTIIIIYYPDTITRIKYEPSRPAILEDGHTFHNFIIDCFYGFSINYRYSNYFETGISFEKNGMIKRLSTFEITMRDERYDYNDELFYYEHGDHEFDYDIINVSLKQSFIYPYKNFNFYTNIGLKTYYTVLKHDCVGTTRSLGSEMYGYDTYSVDATFHKKYSGYNFGFTSALGVSYNISKNISIFGNAGYTWAKLKLKKGLQMDYYYEYSDPSHSIINSKPEAQEIAPENNPFGNINYKSWNFSIGIRYTFVKK